MPKPRVLLLSMSLVAALGGCASPPPVVTANPDAEVLERLASSAERVSISMQRMATIRNAPAAKLPPVTPPPGLDAPLTLNYSGPIEGLARKIAELSGYTFGGVTGPQPMTPVIVSVSVSGSTAFAILMDIGAQAGSAADLIVRPQAKRIDLKYPPLPRTGSIPAVGAAK